MEICDCDLPFAGFTADVPIDCSLYESRNAMNLKTNRNPTRNEVDQTLNSQPQGRDASSAWHRKLSASDSARFRT